MTPSSEWDRKSPNGRRDARMLRWLRREVNRDLREWRAAARTGSLDGHPVGLHHATAQVDDCKAKLAMLRWAEGWQNVRDPGRVAGGARVQGIMLQDLTLVMAAVRHAAAGYQGRGGYQPEWAPGHQ